MLGESTDNVAMDERVLGLIHCYFVSCQEITNSTMLKANRSFNLCFNVFMYFLLRSYSWHYNFPLDKKGLLVEVTLQGKRGRLDAPIIMDKEFRHFSILRHRRLPHQEFAFFLS